MKLATAQKIVAKLTDKGIECALHEEYSGRAMYGRTTTGVVIRSSYDERQACATARGLATKKVDNMGRGLIFY